MKIDEEGKMFMDKTEQGDILGKIIERLFDTHVTAGRSAMKLKAISNNFPLRWTQLSV